MYFHTDNPITISTLARDLMLAAEDGRSLRLDVDSEGRLKFKVGEGMWSAPIESTEDPHRDPRPNRGQFVTETIWLKPQA